MDFSLGDLPGEKQSALRAKGRLQSLTSGFRSLISGFTPSKFLLGMNERVLQFEGHPASITWALLGWGVGESTFLSPEKLTGRFQVTASI
jgi:hypothetical protein